MESFEATSGVMCHAIWAQKAVSFREETRVLWRRGEGRTWMVGRRAREQGHERAKEIDEGDVEVQEDEGVIQGVGKYRSRQIH